MSNNYKYQNLIFEGSGMSGLSYIGVLKVLEELNIISNIKNFAGTSSGAIMSFFVSIGYTSQELSSLCRDIDWKNLVQKRNLLFSLIQFWKKYAIFKYDNIEKIIKEFCFRKLGKNDITFKEHYELTGKNLILVGCNITKKKSEYFCNDLTPNMSVITAVKISSSFPFVFDPIKHNNMLYIDGGVMNNFPIEYFGFKNSETLGVKLTSTNTKQESKENITNIYHYGINILQSIYLIQEQMDLEFADKNIIYIKVNGNIFNNIILMNQNLDYLYQQGVKDTKTYFDILLKEEEHLYDS